jgi:hypothetical protein
MKTRTTDLFRIERPTIQPDTLMVEHAELDEAMTDAGCLGLDTALTRADSTALAGRDPAKSAAHPKPASRKPKFFPKGRHTHRPLEKIYNIIDIYEIVFLTFINLHSKNTSLQKVDSNNAKIKSHF